MFAALNSFDGASVVGGSFSGALSMSAGLMAGSEQDAINTYVFMLPLSKLWQLTLFGQLAKGNRRQRQDKRSPWTCQGCHLRFYPQASRECSRHWAQSPFADAGTTSGPFRKRATLTDWDEVRDMLQGGLFTSPTDSADYDAFEDSFEKIFRSVIVGAAYSQDQVFIAKASVSIWKEDPCTADIGDMDDARVCIDGTAYVFIRTDDIRKYTGAGDWTNPAGIKELKDGADENGFDLVDIVKSSIWFQDEFGGYGKQPSLSDLANYVDGHKDGPPKRLWINLPIIDYDNIHPVSRNANYRYGKWDYPKVSFLLSSTHAIGIPNTDY